MSRQGYAYATAPVRAANHGTSSAFSSSANPDEDWTKISDLAERRRIQNRIAQRNYRKKLKRRLEDLERRAGSSSASPPQLHAELQQPALKGTANKIAKNVTTAQRFKRSPELIPRQPSPRLLQSQYTPPMHNDEDLLFNQFSRDGSHTPPLFAYNPYPAPEETYYQPYPTQAPPPHAYRHPYDGYLTQQAPVTLPSMMHFTDVKREPEEVLAPFNLSYGGLPTAALDMHPQAHPYDISNPHTPPSLSHSYEHSTCSESAYQYPTTPLSMPPSPPLMTHM